MQVEHVLEGALRFRFHGVFVAREDQDALVVEQSRGSCSACLDCRVPLLATHVDAERGAGHADGAVVLSNGEVAVLHGLNVHHDLIPDHFAFRTEGDSVLADADDSGILKNSENRPRTPFTDVESVGQAFAAEWGFPAEAPHSLPDVVFLEFGNGPAHARTKIRNGHKDG